MNKEDVISDIQDCYEKHGEFNGAILNSDDEFCCRTTLQNKFGSVSQASSEAGVPHNNKPQQKEKIDIECLRCGNIRKVYPYRAKKEFPDETSQNCKQCMDKKEKVSCSWCGDRLIRHKYRVESAENFFCDDECFGNWRSKNISGESHPNYDGGYTDPYGENWSSIREKVINRDGKECQECKISRERHLSEKNIDLDVHHIKPRQEFIDDNMSIEEANDMNNLETLCRSCHMKKEWK
jgi:5-methylcytosine-specific restriction endonuclease McrA